MSDLNGVNGVLRAVSVEYLPAPASERFRAGAGTVVVDPQADEVELSELGTALARMNQTSGGRIGKIARIRAAIADGSYEIAPKLDKVVDRLLDELTR